MVGRRAADARATDRARFARPPARSSDPPRHRRCLLVAALCEYYYHTNALTKSVNRTCKKSAYPVDNLLAALLSWSSRAEAKHRGRAGMLTETDRSVTMARRANRASREETMLITRRHVLIGRGAPPPLADDLSRLRPGAAAEEEGHLQGRLRADREQQSLASGPDRQHEGRSRQARLAARLHRRRRFGRQAGRRRQQHDRAGRRLHLPAAARRKAADSRPSWPPRRPAFRCC